MKAEANKVWACVLVSVFASAVLVGTASVSAKAGKSEAVQAKETIAEFMATVELGNSVYTFDHDQDGVVDLAIYPLKTSKPDLKTRYATLDEALNNREVILRESPLISPSRENPQGTYPVVAQYYGFPSGYSSPYYPRGGLTGGGFQNRGFSSGGFLGLGTGYNQPYGNGYSPGGSYYRGYRGYSGGFGFDGNVQKTQMVEADMPVAVAYGEAGRVPAKLKAAEKPSVEVGAFCFEKWRLIEKSRLRGEPEFFNYVGLASPFVRKELLTFSNQKNIHLVIEAELRQLGVVSPTEAMADALKDPRIKSVIGYYVENAKKMLGENEPVSGMVVTDRNRILCADVYSSPELFGKMLAQLSQSAALAACQPDKMSRKRVGREDVESFLESLKQVEKLRKETSQTYKLYYPKAASAAELYSDESGTRVAHVEAYPR